ncbi:hypothetical protein Trydic_g19510 [Trypoxylus dichotomus]
MWMIFILLEKGIEPCYTGSKANGMKLLFIKRNTNIVYLGKWRPSNSNLQLTVFRYRMENHHRPFHFFPPFKSVYAVAIIRFVLVTFFSSGNEFQSRGPFYIIKRAENSRDVQDEGGGNGKVTALTAVVGEGGRVDDS